MHVIEGKLSASGLKVALVAARFNGFIVEHLVQGALDALVRHGATSDDITLYRCPGAFELPQVARFAADTGVDAVIVLGCVIRGATAHFDYVAGEAAKGVGELARRARAVVTFGVLTTDTIEQAIERSGTKAGNKGFDAALAAIEMVQLVRTMGGAPARAG